MKISGMQSAMVAPLISPNDGRVFGVLYVDNLSRTLAFSQEELNVLAVVATQAAAAIDGLFAHERLAAEAIQRQALGRFLAPEVVKMVEENPDGVRLGGTNQRVTVLFCDIRGFTSMSETMAPEKVVEVLNEYFTGVTKAIFDHGGTLDKYIGDAAMAIFGAPVSKGNDAQRAVDAGLAIQRLVTEMNRDATKRGHPEIKVGVGINSGVVTAGNIGSPQRLDYTVIGDEVNLASRMCGKAEAGQVLITESTFNEVREHFNLTPLASGDGEGQIAADQYLQRAVGRGSEGQLTHVSLVLRDDEVVRHARDVIADNSRQRFRLRLRLIAQRQLFRMSASRTRTARQRCLLPSTCLTSGRGCNRGLRRGILLPGDARRRPLR